MGSWRGAGLRHWWIGLLVVLLAGCTSDSAETSREADTPRSAASSTQSSPTATAPPLPFVGPSSPLLQDLWVAIESLPPLRTRLPQRLDFEEIRQSARITDEPIDSAVLAVGADPGAYQIGDPAVVTADGQWRMVERDELGMRSPNMFEQQFELSPDGSTLALGDAFGIVFVNLSTGTTKRVGTELRDPVLHSWTVDGRGVLVTRRFTSVGANPAWKIAMTGRDVARVPFDPWRSATGADDRIAEFVPARTSPRSKLSFTDVRMWRDGRLLSTHPLKVGVPQEASIANEWSSLVGIRQDPSRRMGSAGGVGALDPSDGQMVGFLPLPRQQLTWVSVQGTLADRWLFLSIPFGDGGGIVAWDPEGRELRAVTSIDEQAAHVSLAGLKLS